MPAVMARGIATIASRMTDEMFLRLRRDREILEKVMTWH